MKLVALSLIFGKVMIEYILVIQFFFPKQTYCNLVMYSCHYLRLTARLTITVSLCSQFQHFSIFHSLFHSNFFHRCCQKLIANFGPKRFFPQRFRDLNFENFRHLHKLILILFPIEFSYSWRSPLLRVTSFPASRFDALSGSII